MASSGVRTARWGSSRKSVRTSLYSACAGARKIREKEDGIMAFFCLVVVMARVSLYSACAGAPKIREKEDGIMAFFCLVIPPKIHKNLIKIHKNRGLEGSGGPWGEVWEPWWPPGEPRSSKMSENHVRGSPWDPPLGGHFRYFRH